MTMRLALIAMLAVATPAWADDVARARALDDQGRAAHAAGDYAAAIRSFKEAYVLAPSPGVLFNLAQAYRLSGDCVDAVLMYRAYLATSPTQDEREISETHLANEMRCASPPPLAPPAAPPPLVNIPAPPPPPPAVAGHHTERDVGIGFAIAGGAALAGALYFAIDAHEAANDVSKFYGTGGAYGSIAETDARGRSSAHWAEGLGIGGAVAIVAGGTLYYLGHRTERPPLDVSITAHGARAGVTWHF